MISYIILIFYLAILIIYGIIRIYRTNIYLKEREKLLVSISKFQSSIKNKFD